jgi:hydroxyethylthiazole kinase-like uncharacterized protein yjeF
MQPVLTVEQMRWCDETTIRSVGIPGILLMENAGIRAAELARDRFDLHPGDTVVIVCGKGNNGGDGFVVARQLAMLGVLAYVGLVARENEIEGDAKTNLQILRRLAQQNSNVWIGSFRSLRRKQLEPDLIVDALFGTGFHGLPTGSFARAIEWINDSGAPVLSLDVPSGVNGNTGIAEGPAVKADCTITFGELKIGLLCNDSRDLTGPISIAEIGIPPSVVAKAGIGTLLIEADDVELRLPERPSTAHKYSVGKVLVIAGSKGYTGAAALCASAALRAGAGAVVLATPEAVYPILARKLSEVIVEPFASTKHGSLSPEAFEKLVERIGWADVVVLGPGLSRNAETAELIMMILTANQSKMLIDADALNALAESGVDELKKSTGKFILTPHTGEMARLVRKSSGLIEKERVSEAQRLAAKIRHMVILKGAPTVVASVDGFAFLNPTGNPGMATVGAGDVLAGIIASLWAQGLSSEDASICGVYLHGLAGDLAAQKLGTASVVAHDLLDYLPMAYRHVKGEAK